MAERVFVTGGSGFVGSHVLAELLAAGFEVRALVRSPNGAKGAAQRHVRNVERVEGDLQNVGAWAGALRGCRYVVHCAALYSFSPRDRAAVRRVNVLGTAGLVEAARIARVERIVLTSSSATLGAARDGRPRTEQDFASEGPGAGYHHSKLEQERAAFAGRVPVVALLPTAPVGPGDWKPTPTGRMILDFARGKMFARPPRGGINLVAVEDVARAHVTALRDGMQGERYVLGGENLLLDDVWKLLAELTGRPLPALRIPEALVLALAYADEARCRVLPNAQPFVPVEGARMARELRFADSAKAKRELRFHASPVRDALQRALSWYREHGYLAS